MYTFDIDRTSVNQLWLQLHVSKLIFYYATEIENEEKRIGYHLSYN